MDPPSPTPSSSSPSSAAAPPTPPDALPASYPMQSSVSNSSSTSPATLLSATPSSKSVADVQANGNGTSIIRRKITSLVGFSNLPAQHHRRSVRKGFDFNVMVVGESGLGKSTLVSTLFNMPLAPPRAAPYSSASAPKTVSIQSISSEIEEKGVKLRLTVVDTPGFGDLINNDDAWRPIVSNVEQRFDSFLEGENTYNRSKVTDSRIHACIYFIAPTGHSLKALDVEVMKKLHHRVNLIPVIAKSDIMSDEEITAFKARIRADLEHHKINIFETPRYELDSDKSMEEKTSIMSKIPFAIVGASSEITTPDGRIVRGRKYPWGIVEVDNEDHCDFVKLRAMLVQNFMEELKEYTDEVLYENYRAQKLIAMGVSQDQSVFKEISPSSKMEEERALQNARLQKMEAEMKMVFQQKVAEKEQKLKRSEDELFARHREMKQQLEKERRELESKLAQAELERHAMPEEKNTKKKFSLRS
ncbi:cell division control protein 3/GTP binding protein [Myxozyma melibiosi]|uniref:Cell division control protein 3/GTP binding protein n=1 Tax=Myxozyma melibiosi TaxID=54550 RepID=A0ABR1FFH5_9ASCO